MALRAGYYGIKKKILNKILPDYTDPDVMTNKELTEKVAKIEDITVTAGTNVTVNANTKVSKIGKVVMGALRFEFTGTLTTGHQIASLSVNPKNNLYVIGIENITNKCMPIIVDTNGYVLFFGSNQPTENNQLIIPINYIAS